MSRAIQLVLMLLSGLASGCAAAAAIENHIAFFPHPYPIGDWSPDPRIQDVYFETPDGVRLHGWLAEPDRGPPRAVVLFNHGNGRNITTRRHVIELYRDQMNATVLVYDYRGYGKSAGHPTEAGLMTDARAARRWLAARAGVPESEIVLAGHSLGTGVAVDLAASDGAPGLILEGAYTSLPDVAEWHVPLLPVRAVMQSKFHSEAKISHYHGPLLQVHGDADGVVPYTQGRRLFEAANEPKQFVTVRNGDHNRLYKPEFVAALDHFLSSLPARKEASGQTGSSTSPHPLPATPGR